MEDVGVLRADARQVVTEECSSKDAPKGKVVGEM
jgi:hypothetical protein